MARFYTRTSLQAVADAATDKYEVDPEVTVGELVTVHNRMRQGNAIQQIITHLNNNPGADEESVAGAVLSTDPDDVRQVLIALIILEHFGQIVGTAE